MASPGQASLQHCPSVCKQKAYPSKPCVFSQISTLESQVEWGSTSLNATRTIWCFEVGGERLSLLFGKQERMFLFNIPFPFVGKLSAS